MTDEIVEQKVMPGECSFCKSQVEKKKMSQHLKSCKQRLEAMAAEKQNNIGTGKPGRKKKAEPVTLFHIMAEGRYNPQYGMHIEMPASDELVDLDHFLRAIWVECCGHLSSFRIGEVDYSDERGDYFDFDFIAGEGNEGQVEVEEEEEEEEGGEIDLGEVLKEFPPELMELLSPQFLAEFVKLRDANEAARLLRAELKRLPKESALFPRNRENQEEFQKQLDVYRRHSALKQALNLMITMLEDRSMYQPLEKLLKVGQVFTYEYDFGSTTHLKLKVIAKREGVITSKQDHLQVLARNLPPEIKCKVCGKPATKVVSGYYNAEESGYCNKCARKSEEYEDMLPVVNSPRIGVCGYTG